MFHEKKIPNLCYHTEVQILLFNRVSFLPRHNSLIRHICIIDSREFSVYGIRELIQCAFCYRKIYYVLPFIIQDRKNSEEVLKTFYSILLEILICWLDSEEDWPQKPPAIPSYSSLHAASWISSVFCLCRRRNFLSVEFSWQHNTLRFNKT
jgi:hypothetical protein